MFIVYIIVYGYEYNNSKPFLKKCSSRKLNMCHDLYFDIKRFSDNCVLSQTLILHNKKSQYFFCEIRHYHFSILLT